MIEIIKFLIEYAEYIPAPVYFAAIGGLLIYSMRRQEREKIEFIKRLDERFEESDCARRKVEESLEDSHQRLDRTKQAIENLNKAIEEDIADQLLEQKKLALRQGIVNEAFPKEHRLELYDEYKRLKGNSFIDKYVRDNLLKEGE